MIWYACLFGTVNFVLLLVHTIRKERANNKILDYLARAEERERQMWDDLLPVVKAYRESARSHHKDAEAAKSELGQKVDEKTTELPQKIDAIPQKVAQVIQASDSGTMKAVPRNG